MARAKNTDRAAARRRSREQQRAQDGAAAADAAALETSDVQPYQPASTGGGLFGSLKMPNVKDDLRTFPHMLLHSPKVWIPFGLLLASFIVAMLLPRSVWTSLGAGIYVPVLGSSVFPTGTDKIAALFVQLTLPPTALFLFFIGGFLAPRASYLVGALLGLVDGILWSIYVFSAGGSAKDGFKAASAQDVLAIIFIAVLIGTVAAGFAAWYRAFLRQSQERARQNRIAREQQMRAKAKEDERKAKEEQRVAAIAAREAQRAERAAAAAAAKAPKPAASTSGETGKK